MLSGHVSRTLEHEYYPVFVAKVLAYLNEQDFTDMPLGRHELPFSDSSKAWMMILEYNKEPTENFLPEVHHHHSDLQIVLSGSELMGWELDSGIHENAQNYLVARDLQFYKPDRVQLSYFAARENQFYLFTPNTVHVTNVDDGVPGVVRKLVVKIHNDLLVAK